MLLIYVRHGEPIYNPDSLTELGHKQAIAVGKRLAKFGVDKIFASTSNRAIQTATPTSEMTGKQVQLLDWCNESYAWQDFALTRDDGVCTWAFYIPKFQRLFAEQSIAYNPNWYLDGRFPQNNFKQGIERVNEEVDKWLLSLGYEHDRTNGVYHAVNPTNERVALFAHQGFGIAFLSSLLDIPYPLFCNHFDIGHSDITVIDFETVDGIAIPKVLTHSNDGHLLAEGLSTLYNYKHEF